MSREKGREKHLSGNASNPEQASVLVHIQGYSANRIRLEDARPQIVDEPQRCGNQSGCPGQLGTTVRSRVIPGADVRSWLSHKYHETDSRTKNGLRARTTGSVCDKYDSYLQGWPISLRELHTSTYRNFTRSPQCS